MTASIPFRAHLLAIVINGPTYWLAAFDEHNREGFGVRAASLDRGLYDPPHLINLAHCQFVLEAVTASIPCRAPKAEVAGNFKLDVSITSGELTRVDNAVPAGT